MCGCRELRQSRGAESREARGRKTRLVVLKGGHRDALPPRKGGHGRKRSREREAHSLQGSESGRGEGVEARPLLQQ